MRVQTRHTYQICALKLVHRVLTNGSGPIRTSDLAHHAGFSRFHLSRVFHDALGESPSEFVRRIQLERAAWRLRTTEASVYDVAEEAGFSGPEAFSRAFRTAYGTPPSKFRRSGRCHRLPSPSDVHWSTEFGVEVPFADFPGWEVSVVWRKPLQAAVLRCTDPRDVARGWLHLEKRLADRPWEELQSQLITIYHDNPRLVLEPGRRRYDVGFTVPKGYVPPEGLKVVSLPAGAYAQTRSFVPRSERGPAWRYMNGLWVPFCGLRPVNVPAFDLYDRYPLPWEEVGSRLVVGLEMDLGKV